MNYKPLVSIIIPVYNGANFLKDAIDSALNQTYKNIEIIVINDGSDDNGATRNISMKYIGLIHYYEKNNGGVSSALNFGINKMSGDYFSWLSHDDIYHRDKIKVQVELLNKNKEKDVILFSNYEIIDKNRNVIKYVNIKYIYDHIIELFVLYKRPFINGNTILIPKEAFNNVGYFNENLRYTQDYDMWARLSKKYKFLYINKYLISSRKHEEQDSIKKQVIRSSSFKINYTKLLDLLEITKKLNNKNEFATIVQMYLVCYAKGGEINQYPITYWRKLLYGVSDGILKKTIYYLLFCFEKVTIIIPYKIKKFAIKNFFIKNKIIRNLID